VSQGSPQIVFVSGLSGSGKTTVMAALEDLGFYCADNLPVQLTGQFLDLCAKATPPIEKIALALDAREGQFLAELPAAMKDVRARGFTVELIFLEADVATLVNRYRETRRVHPLSPEGSVEQGIAAERGRLAEVAALADRVIDTTRLNVHELRTAIFGHVTGVERALVVNLVSFGFRHGPPPAMELQFDVRFLPNPYFDERLRPQTGCDEAVARYVLDSARGAVFFRKLCEWLDFLLPHYDDEGKSYVNVGVGCTGGRHRSVAIVEALASYLRDRGREVNVQHRDVEKES
jgi:UPF0042 nucleotide-binding protein